MKSSGLIQYCLAHFSLGLSGLPRIRLEMLGIAAKYDVDNLHYSTETVKNAAWLSFVNSSRF